jgi:hypothetical protein
MGDSTRRCGRPRGGMGEFGFRSTFDRLSHSLSLSRSLRSRTSERVWFLWRMLAAHLSAKDTREKSFIENMRFNENLTHYILMQLRKGNDLRKLEGWRRADRNATTF